MSHCERRQCDDKRDKRLWSRILLMRLGADNSVRLFIESTNVAQSEEDEHMLKPKELFGG